MCHFILDCNFHVSWWISTLCTNEKKNKYSTLRVTYLMVPHRLWCHTCITSHVKILFLRIMLVRRVSCCLVTHTNTPDFIGPEMWQPNSPDLNPVDYSIKMVCCGAAHIPGAHSEHWWTLAESANHLERSWAADHWQCCRPMERSFGSLCVRRGWTFW